MFYCSWIWNKYVPVKIELFDGLKFNTVHFKAQKRKMKNKMRITRVYCQ